MADQAHFPKRYRGPGFSANGGYACGVVAKLVGGDIVEVTLRSPPPLDVPVAVERQGKGVVLRYEGKVVAEGKPSELSIDVPRPPSFEEAMRASHPGGAMRPEMFEHHVLPECFVCGITREQGDALCLWPGPAESHPNGLIATTWTPHESVCDAHGLVEPEVTWAALDCPSGLAFFFTEPKGTAVLLGRLTAQIDKPLKKGARYIQIGWQLGKDNRKLFGGSALFAEDGTLHAKAKATWLKM